MMRLPTMDDLDQGLAEERAAEWQRFLAAGGQPTPVSPVQARAIGPNDPGETAPTLGVVEVPLVAEPPVIPPPAVDPMVWCEVCGRAFQYKDPKRKGFAVVQMLRHKRKEHDGLPWDDRGTNPEARKRKIGRTMRKRWKEAKAHQEAKPIEAPPMSG